MWILTIAVTSLIMCVVMAVTVYIYRLGLRDGQDTAANRRIKEAPKPFPTRRKKTDGENGKTLLNDFDEGIRNIMTYYNRHKKTEDKE